jgi:predicted nucleic acid-binding protein
MSDAPVVLCNAGPLIALGKLNQLELLADLYPQVCLPQVVYHEVVTQGLVRGAAEALTVRLFWEQQHWPVIAVSDTVLAAYTPTVILGPGERAVLALAQTLSRPLVLLDDEAARAEARRLNVSVSGTVGIVVAAYRCRRITFTQAEFLLQEIAARPDIWISAQLCQQVLVELRGQDIEKER